ncbi:MAG: adenosylmethionine--8-amino-7-oxononanoate transaminase [Peptococcaceae bacterium]|jgi:adenosylmethionine-8-amino-7-oxononanoate aminotransferase|nr:adenosylmethionine--8-amino-7-oxononanoate transaminase [Peptococcaceae bacterium]
MNEGEYAALLADDAAHVWYPFTQMRDYLAGEPLFIERAQGVRLYDVKGRGYYDGVSSLWLNVHGHGHPHIDRAVKEQLDRMAHSTMLGLGHPGAVRLAKKLVDLTPAGLNKVFYSDNGSTAVEIALKMAFQYWRHRGETGRTSFLTLGGAYHGDTIGSVSVGGIDLFHRLFRPLLFPTVTAPPPYCYRCRLGLTHPACGLACAEAFGELLLRHRTELAAAVVEPLIQGAGGMITAPPGYLARIRELCTEYGVLLITDEVATGFGRTGRMFACEHEGVSPDLMTLSKGISAGYLPLAATLATDEIYAAFLGLPAENKTFFHGHSYTGNPLAVAAALASLEVFEQEDTLAGMQPKMAYLSERLARFTALPQVGDIRRRGFMTGIELVADKETGTAFPASARYGARVCRTARQKGMIIRPLDDVVVFMPPLATSLADLAVMLDILEESVREAAG